MSPTFLLMYSSPSDESGSLSRVAHWELNSNCWEQNTGFEEDFLTKRKDVMSMQESQGPSVCFIYPRGKRSRRAVHSTFSQTKLVIPGGRFRFFKLHIHQCTIRCFPRDRVFIKFEQASVIFSLTFYLLSRGWRRYLLHSLYLAGFFWDNDLWIKT